MKKLLLSLALVGCQTTDPAPRKRQLTPFPKPKLHVNPDENFVSEFDWCWDRYVECQKFFSKKSCFPAQEECAVKAYRKLKKARKNVDPI